MAVRTEAVEVDLKAHEAREALRPRGDNDGDAANRLGAMVEALRPFLRQRPTWPCRPLLVEGEDVDSLALRFAANGLEAEIETDVTLAVTASFVGVDGFRRVGPVLNPRDAALPVEFSEHVEAMCARRPQIGCGQ